MEEEVLGMIAMPQDASDRDMVFNTPALAPSVTETLLLVTRRLHSLRFMP